MAKVIMTSVQLVERLENLANRRTFYKNKYPDNLCYVHADGRTSADCVNLYKALLNGYDVNNTTVGYFQSSLSNTGDCTEWGLMKQCSDVSTDFKKLKEGEPRLLYKDGHIGGYIGKEVTRNGKVYNCIECTAAWGGGILYSYVTTTGGRYNCKGGSKNGAWTHNGLMTPWVEYVKPNPNVYDGVDYTDVYDLKFYKAHYPDLEKAYGNDSDRYIEHFVKFGMVEGRQAKADFNVWVYQSCYPDLYKAYGEDMWRYYEHYIKFGKNENRNANPSYYDLVFNAQFYAKKYKDLAKTYGNDANLLIKHFLQHGMIEARQACEGFNVVVYKANYEDLRRAFGDDLPLYYIHYIRFGHDEGRNAVTPIN